jgi:signal transduction histidine kinase
MRRHIPEAGNEDMDEASRRVEVSVRHALRLVRDVLDLTTLEAGHLATWPRSFDVHDVLESVTQILGPHADARDIRMLTDCDAELRLVADPDRVRQIVLNLLSNAVKFSGGPGTVHLSGHRAASGPSGEAGPWMTIAVQDEGPGIPPEAVERVFRPFERSGLTGLERDGTGLGLTISRHLAEHMGGALTVEARAGEGSTFTLWLPADREPEQRPGWLG